MNLLLLFPEDLVEPGRAVVTGRRCRQLREDPQRKPGHSLQVGMLDGQMGTGVICRLDRQQAEITFSLDTPPPPPSPVTLILALPRPKVLSRTLAAATSLGIKDIYLTNSVNVQKSYWQSPHLKQESIDEALLAGLEQARDTRLPRLHWRRFFRELAEQDLARLSQSSRTLLAAPSREAVLPAPGTETTTLVVGPETGFSADETRTFLDAGFQLCSLGPRILRVETALPALIGRLVATL